MKTEKIKSLLIDGMGRYFLVFAFAVVLFIVTFWKYNHDIDLLKNEYFLLEHTRSMETVRYIEEKFKVMRHGLRTIARLPDVKELDQNHDDFDENAWISIQELYNTLIKDVYLSEVYISSVNIELGEVNPETGKAGVPLFSFESAIGEEGHDEGKEGEEYRLINQHLAWMKNNIDIREKMLVQKTLFISGPEITTCDTRFISIPSGNKGLIFSTPFYDYDDKLKGSVSAIILTGVIREMLPNNYTYLVNNANGLVIGKHGAMNNEAELAVLKTAQPDPDRIYSEALKLDIQDVNTDWFLWVSYPDSYLWNKREVRTQKQYFVFLSAILTAFLLLGIFYIRLENKIDRQEKIYKLNLEEKINHRTKELKEEVGKHHNTIEELAKARDQLAILLDDNEKKLDETEDMLDQKESHLKAIFDTVIDSIITINKQGIIKDCNPAIEKITGHRPEEIIGKTINTIMPRMEASRHDTYIRKYQETGKANIMGIGREVRAQHKDGRVVPIDLAITSFDSGGETYYVGVIRDVTEQRKMIETMERARDSAIDSSRIKSEFLANMSHELRTPMNGVLGFIQLLEDTHLDDEQLAYLDTISDSANGLMGIINDALDFTRIGSGKLRIENIDFNIRMTIDSIVDFFKNMANTKGIRLQAQLSSKIPLQLMGPPGRLRQIMVNLVNNAMKYTEEGEINIRVGVLEEHESNVLLIVEVEDTGIGIDKKSQKDIFDSFRQVDGSITRSHTGLGLGLAITKSLVEMIGGEIGVNSVEGEGSTFWFTMQLSKTELPDIKSDSISLLKDKRILILDDDQDSAEVLQSKLTACHAHSKTISSPLDAIQYMRDKTAESAPADMLIIDVKKGLVDWREIIHTINKDDAIENPRKVVLISSGQRGFGDVAKSLGVMAYLTKPIEDTDLLSALNTVMSKEVDNSESLITRYTISEMHNAKLSDRILVVDDVYENQKKITHLLSTGNLRSDVAESMQYALDSLNYIEYGFILFNPASEHIDIDKFVECVRLHDEMQHLYHPIIAIMFHDNMELRKKCEQAGVNEIISDPVDIDTIKAIVQNWMKKAS